MYAQPSRPCRLVCTQNTERTQTLTSCLACALAASFFFVAPLRSYRGLQTLKIADNTGCSQFTIISIPAFLGFFAPSLAALGTFCTLGSMFSVFGFASLTFGASLRQDPKKEARLILLFDPLGLSSRLDILPEIFPRRLWWRWSWQVAPACPSRSPFSGLCGPSASTSPSPLRGISVW